MSFFKPIVSKQKELNLEKPMYNRSLSSCGSTSNNIKKYYLAKVGNFAKFIKRHGLNRKTWGHGSFYQYFTKEEIDKVPKHYRRGCEYGHDIVVFDYSDHRYRDCFPELMRFCKSRELEYITVNQSFVRLV
jgi:hypothetical protein